MSPFGFAEDQIFERGHEESSRAARTADGPGAADTTIYFTLSHNDQTHGAGRCAAYKVN